MTDQPNKPLADEIEHLRERADSLEEQATQDGIPSRRKRATGSAHRLGVAP